MSGCGALPWSARRFTSRRLLSGIQRMPPFTVFNGCSSNRRALRAFTSTSHSELLPVYGSIRLSARYRWSGDHATEASDSGDGRPSMRSVLPVATSISHRSLANEARLGE